MLGYFVIREINSIPGDLSAMGMAAAAVLIRWTCLGAAFVGVDAMVQRRMVLRGVVGTLGAGFVGTEAFMRLPMGIAKPPASLANALQVSDMTVIVGGSAGPDRYTQNIANALRRIGRKPLILDWRTNADGSDWSIFSSAIQAGSIARRYGTAIGEQMGHVHPHSVHVIGVSAGGFAADSLIMAVRRISPDTHLRLTLLDAFTAGDLVEFASPGHAAGVSLFGASADYCEAFINTDDPVPSTTVPLQRAVNFDVTSSSLRSQFELEAASRGDSMHLWPAEYYAKMAPALLTSERGVLPKHGERGFADRGSVIK